MYRIVRYSQPRTAGLPSAVRSAWSGLEQEIDRLFGDFAAPAVSPRFPVDLYEDSDNSYVRAELPGIKREDINVELVDGYLTISATRKDGPENNESSFSLSRSVAISEQVQADKVAAQYENGVLTVTLPKQEKAKPRKIAINVN